MRISDWSSDVCSSDLPRRRGRRDIVPYHLSRLARDQFRRIAHVKPQESFAEQPVGAIKLGELDERARGILLGQRERFAAVEQQVPAPVADTRRRARSEEHTSELQSLMRISYAVLCLKKKIIKYPHVN